MRRIQSLNIILRHVYTEPKFQAMTQWAADHSGLAMQLEQQVGHDALAQYVATGRHPNPERRISFVRYAEPDWDWWEPRYDQPWRRQAARDRELDRLLARAGKRA